MKKFKLNLNQKKTISNLFISLSASLISILVVTPVFSKINYDSLTLLAIATIFILSITMIILSVYILKK